jgi:glycosyltransferase involved in cell wall biosynthesis
MSKPLNVIQLVAREAFGPVIRSQVITPLSLHGDEIQKRIVLMTPVRQFISRASRQELTSRERSLRESKGIELTHLPSFSSRAKFYYRDSWLLGWWLDRHFGRDQLVILQCRNSLATGMALDVRRTRPNVRVIFDCRGAAPAEVLYRHGLNEDNPESWPRDVRESYRYFSQTEARACGEADHIIAVSAAMVDYLRKRYKTVAGPFSIVPCCIDASPFDQTAEDRKAVREEYRFGDKFVVCYCGSLEAYQLPDQCLRVFHLIQRRVPNAFFLAITTHPARMEAAILEAGVDSSCTQVISAAPEEVPRLLASADVGLLLRDRSIVNRVAAPLKFAEYLASGLPVILTPSIGDYSDFVLTNHCGLIVDLMASDETLEPLLSEWCDSYKSNKELKARIKSLAFERFSWGAHRLAASTVYGHVDKAFRHRAPA